MEGDTEGAGSHLLVTPQLSTNGLVLGMQPRYPTFLAGSQSLGPLLLPPGGLHCWRRSQSQESSPGIPTWRAAVLTTGLNARSLGLLCLLRALLTNPGKTAPALPWEEAQRLTNDLLQWLL